jgi:hypothetical protein
MAPLPTLPCTAVTRTSRRRSVGCAQSSCAKTRTTSACSCSWLLRRRSASVHSARYGACLPHRGDCADREMLGHALSCFAFVLGQCGGTVAMVLVVQVLPRNFIASPELHAALPWGGVCKSSTRSQVQCHPVGLELKRGRHCPGAQVISISSIKASGLAQVDNMTRMMLDSNRSSLDGKPKKDNRRETWCPGAGAPPVPVLMCGWGCGWVGRG